MYKAENVFGTKKILAGYLKDLFTYIWMKYSLDPDHLTPSPAVLLFII